MKALVIGATGSTGKHLVSVLLRAEAVSEVHIFVRRPVALEHPKLYIHIVDFEAMESWASLVVGDVAFSCLGTTIKQAGSREAQHRVDVAYQVGFAELACRGGVRTFVLLSALGANARSRVFYNRLKGEAEERIGALGFARTLLVRPSVLIREESGRLGEALAVRVLNGLNRFGLLKRYAPLATSVLAGRLVELALEGGVGLRVVSRAEL